MRSFEVKVAGKCYDFVCSSENTRHGFRHLCDVLDNGYPMMDTARIPYLNRTWERFQFESVMVKALDALAKHLGITDAEREEARASLRAAGGGIWG